MPPPTRPAARLRLELEGIACTLSEESLSPADVSIFGQRNDAPSACTRRSRRPNGRRRSWPPTSRWNWTRTGRPRAEGPRKAGICRNCDTENEEMAAACCCCDTPRRVRKKMLGAAGPALHHGTRRLCSLQSVGEGRGEFIGVVNLAHHFCRRGRAATSGTLETPAAVAESSRPCGQARIEPRFTPPAMPCRRRQRQAEHGQPVGGEASAVVVAPVAAACKGRTNSPEMHRRILPRLSASEPAAPSAR